MRGRRVNRIQGKQEWKTGTESGNGNYQWKMPDEGYQVNTHVRFFSMMLLCRIVGPFQSHKKAKNVVRPYVSM